jgi:hypothetical protein
VCQDELVRKFIDGATAFYESDFPRYSDLTSMTCEDIPLEWKESSGDSAICHLTFNFGHTQVFARNHDKESGQSLFVTQEEFYRCQDNVQRQFVG